MPVGRWALLRSGDAGRTWSDVTGPFANTSLGTGTLSLNVPLAYPGKLFVGGDGGTWVYEERDAGR